MDFIAWPKSIKRSLATIMRWEPWPKGLLQSTESISLSFGLKRKHESGKRRKYSLKLKALEVEICSQFYCLMQPKAFLSDKISLWGYKQWCCISKSIENRLKSQTHSPEKPLQSPTSVATDPKVRSARHQPNHSQELGHRRTAANKIYIRFGNNKVNE